MKQALFLCVLVILAQSLAWAETEAEEPVKNLEKQLHILQEEVRRLSQMVKTQQEIIANLELKQARLETPPLQPAESAPSQAEKSAPAPARSAPLSFNPEIGLVADIVGSVSKTIEDEEGNNRLSVREMQLVLGHDVDPYTRFDATITLSDFEDVEIEEAYASYWGLPWGMSSRIGRAHQKIGKASAVHRDSLETVDQPLVVQRYLGAEGLFRTGVDFTGFTPFSSDTFVQSLTLGVMEGGMGEGGELFGPARDKPSFYGRLSNFFDFSEENNFEVGLTYLLGANEEEQSFRAQGFGLDGTYVHHLTPQSKFKLQSEFLFQRRSSPKAQHEDRHEHGLFFTRHGGHGEEAEEFDSGSFGYYLLADYRLNKRWGMGSRYDWVQPVALYDDYQRAKEQAMSAYLTFYQSEYARWRFQYQYARLLDGEDDNRFFLQALFAIGEHKHKLQ